MTDRLALVTGAHGFIGRHVARRLAAAGWRVEGLGHGDWAKEEHEGWGISEWHAADVDLDQLMKWGGRPGMVVHCAGSGSVGFSLRDPYQDFRRTVATTAAVLEYIRFHAPEACVVYPSSGAVYGAARFIPTPEDAPLLPVSPYAVNKLLGEQLCASYAREFGIRTAVVRLFSVYGTGLRKQLLWEACRKIEAGQHEFFGTGDEARDWTYVKDAAALLTEAGEHADASCPVVNGGTGVAVTVRDVLQELFAALGKPGGPVFNGVVRVGDPPKFHADIARARAWGWQPQVGWKEGVREYADWFRKGAA